MKRTLVCVTILSAIHAAALVGLAAELSGTERWENLAHAKPYTLHPRPNYSHCTDPGDKTQLTDGQVTSGYFWTQKTTVGWNRARPVEITIDLEQDSPIRGLSFQTAAGVAGVGWPISIQVLVSIDGYAYHALGDLD